MTARGIRLGLALVFLLTWGMAAAGLAQSQGAPSNAGIASAAFAQGQALQVAGDHAGAAEAFELADRTLPAAAALRASIVNRMAAGQNARAATLALRAEERYPDDLETRELARTTLKELSSRLTRVTVHCAVPCTVSMANQVLVPTPALHSSFFVVPGAQNLEIAFDAERKIAHRIETHEGEAIERAFEPPPAPEPAPAPAPPDAVSPEAEAPATGPDSSSAPGAALAPLAPVAQTQPEPQPARDAPREKLSPAYFWVGLGLTAALGGASVWSGLDALSGVDAYERAPTKARYDAGHDREVRTNVLIGTSAALALGTATLALFFTDWSGPEHNVHASVSVGARSVDSSLSVAF